jgi:hypothetical protein
VPDRTVSSTDRSSSGTDRKATGTDRTSTGIDHTASGTDRTSSGVDHIASGTDRTSSGTGRTGADHTASGLSATSGKDLAVNSAGSNSRNRSGRTRLHDLKNNHPDKDIASSDVPAGQKTTQQAGQGIQSPSSTAAPEPAGPYRSYVQGPRSLRGRPYISDSALRAYVPPTPTNPGKKSGPSLLVNRSLTFGFQASPDFASVNTLSGDKPGLSLGVTVDYQILHGLHLGTGLLYAKKNYTARGVDYHVPPDYYWRNNLKGVDFVKGTMTMLEIPLTLRYDFSVTGNTIFFASGGVSSYLFGTENCNYYFDFFGREACRPFQYSNKPGLFSTASLSLGVETGISNSVSLQLAPYMKLPVSDMGFGRIRMNSVGIDFSIRYAPVLSRRRKH